MNSTQAGLKRFARQIISKRSGTCAFCARPTQAGYDYAAVDGAGKWIAVCGVCAVSIQAQVKGVVNAMQDAMVALPAEHAHRLPEVQALIPETLGAALQDGALDTVAYDVLVKLQAAQAALKAIGSEAAQAGNTLLADLQAIAANAEVSPNDRSFAGSLADSIIRRGSLTDKQAFYANKLVKRYANGATPAEGGEAAGVGLYSFADGTVRKVYMTRNDRFACKVLTVHGDHGSFEYETGGRRIVTEALADGTAHLMTQDEAAAFGRQYSFCCNCALGLDDDRSLAAGYGPVCAENNGWYYPTYAEAATILQRPVTTPAGKVIDPA